MENCCLVYLYLTEKTNENEYEEEDILIKDSEENDEKVSSTH
jgi:hypothetical protein